MTRLLVLSDIHGAVPAVRALVRREKSPFDAVVVAGDIGPPATRIIRELRVLDSPVLYVLGNWDYDCAYDTPLGVGALHLHGTSVQVGELLFLGFSGCATQWGRNPIWRAFRAEVEDEHRDTLAALKAAKQVDATLKAEILAWRDEQLVALVRRIPDRRRAAYRAAAESLNERCDARIRRACRSAEQFRGSDEFQRLQLAEQHASQRAHVGNRGELVRRICQSGHDPAKVVLVTHERLYRLHEDVPGLGAHLFGHRHGFKITEKRGTAFVNVSSLDPRGLADAEYGVIEWTPSRGFSVHGKHLPGSGRLLGACIEYNLRHPPDLVIPEEQVQFRQLGT